MSILEKKIATTNNNFFISSHCQVRISHLNVCISLFCMTITVKESNKVMKLLPVHKDIGYI